ncbi:DUF350 domain-containing protein [Candidatus Marinimicrobia bacterium MT.SAG.3]|nr:DUF350 domain-containing protein [Candidatus Neomarinimicrobiota bacterium]MCH8305676.1 DUF350 domain-containing protein [Candidatus Neomarinimicrobiota bacterium]TFB09458.1 DUF350 domain-containing protein [Candidatus Marinimicrobia bacterium MT.SAG.2]TFB12549.1 DUF350 domain-containing protein [Candidatus Marinimicrobia bacterium MT.SAG.3]
MEIDLMTRLAGYFWSLIWAVVASVGFAFGVGLALMVFNWLSKDIDEWQEIKNGNYGVAAIIVTLILMVGLVVHRVL